MTRSEQLDRRLAVLVTTIENGEDVDRNAEEIDLEKEFGDLPEFADALTVLHNAEADA